MLVKIGGSLLEYSREILKILKKYDPVIVPGGGVFAELVRRIYSGYGISEKAAHRMAILAMEQYGLFLSDISGIPSSYELGNSRPFIFLPSRLLEEEPLKASWDVTSDTIACHVAKLLGERIFIKLTDVDGVLVRGRYVKEISATELLKIGTTCVDKELPKYLMKYGINCWVVNGKRLENVDRAMRGNIKGTLISH
jgi:hypothetical protein